MLKIKFTIIPTALCFFFFLLCTADLLLYDNEPVKKQLLDPEIYLLIGQSNMAGRAEIEEQDKNTLENVFLYTGSIGKEWAKAANPINKYSTVRKIISMQKLGPGCTFAIEMIPKNSGKQIELAVNAWGGTSIEEWVSGSELYNEAIKRTKLAMKSVTLKGILWHQGEANSSKPETYLEKIAELIKSFRTELGIPHLPFIAGQLSEDKPPRHDFNAMIYRLPAIVPHTWIAPTKRTVAMIGTHFNSTSQRLLGERYAFEMLKLIHH